MLALLLIAGGALRASVASAPTAFQSADEASYARLAHAIVRQHDYKPTGMADPVRWGPGAPFAFAVAQRLFGEGGIDDHDVPAAYAWQAVFGTLLIAAVFILGWLIAGEIAGLLAAAATALYPPLIDASGDLLSEPLGALLLAVSLIAVILALRRPRWWLAGGAGLLIGITVLTRVDLLGLPVVAALVIAVAVWRGVGRGVALLASGALLAGCLLVLVPWSVYASSESDRVVLVTSGSSTNLFIGTFLPGDGRIYGVKEYYADAVRKRHPSYADRPYASLPQEWVLAEIEHEHPGLDRDAALQAGAKQNIRRYLIGDPVGYAGMTVSKVWRLWGWPTRGSGRHRELWMRYIHVPLVIVATIGMVLGLLARRGRDASLWLLFGVLAYVTLTNAALVAEARHNLPVMPVLLVAGAAGFVLAHGRKRTGRTAVAVDPGANRTDEQRVEIS